MVAGAPLQMEGSGGLTFALQALLARHESYMAESEEERRMMAACMSQLEDDKRNVEAENARVVQENKELLQQLHEMNAQIADSDAHIESLMATLSSAQFENKRMMALAVKTAEFEAQLAAMEIEQAQVQEELATSKEDERSAINRWRFAENRLRALNEQVHQMEREARDEREKHVEIIGRMERRRAVEKDLETAAGRLKGAAAASTLGKNKNGTNVVSHFVRDILQDNANLQAGILELRELLQTSNEEVQNLREQVLQHQPVSGDESCQPASLRDEIEQMRPRSLSKEVHVHHHYHAKISTRRERTSCSRRPSRRRGPFSYSSSSSTGYRTPTSHGSLDMTKMPHPRTQRNRRSTQSSTTNYSTMSSLIESPYSNHRDSSVFDQGDLGFESSRPTSPESACLQSPRFLVDRANTCLEGLPPAFPELATEDENEIPETCGRSMCVAENTGLSSLGSASVAAEPPKPNTKTPPNTKQNLLELMKDYQPKSNSVLPPTQAPDTFDIWEPQRAHLRRSNSHESLMSISGMDIHLPQHRKAQLSLLRSSSATSDTADPLKFSIAGLSLQPLASIVEVNASSSNLASPSDHKTVNSLSLLAGFAGSKHPAQQSKGLGGLVGSWVRGRWGIAPVASMRNLRDQATNSTSASRMPGINQQGPIMGLRPPARTPDEVHVKVLDQGLLKESLAE
jgi:hypothetical protein